MGMSLPEIDKAYNAYMRKIVYDDYPLQWHLGGWGGT